MQCCQKQEVTVNVRFYDRTDSLICQTGENHLRTTKNAHELHKYYTRVLPGSPDEVPADLNEIIAAWPSLPNFVKDAIMALVSTNGQHSKERITP